MNEDIKRVLEELEQDLWKDEPAETAPVENKMTEEDLLEDVPQKLKDNQNTPNHSSPSEEDDIDAILARILAENDEFVGVNQPAFEDPDKLDIVEEPVAYRNYSNDYGSHAAGKSRSARKRNKSEDKWLIALMSVASVLCLGIIGVLVYWMQLIP